MSCEGCSNAVKNILGKIPEITSVETDVAKQEVVVKGTVTADLVIEKLTPWAKAYVMLYYYFIYLVHLKKLV